MGKYRIESKAGEVFGIYEGDTAQAAWDAMVAEAGATDATDCEGRPTAGTMADWIVVEVQPSSGPFSAKIRGRFIQRDTVEAIAAAWCQYRDECAEGVSRIGNGVDVLDCTGRRVARVSYNGRIWPEAQS